MAHPMLREEAAASQADGPGENPKEPVKTQNKNAERTQNATTSKAMPRLIPERFRMWSLFATARVAKARVPRMIRCPINHPKELPKTLTRSSWNPPSTIDAMSITA